MRDIFKNRKAIMKQWDKWRQYIAEGGGGTWPRDSFESLLDYYDGKLSASQPPVEADAEKAGICPKCNKPFSSMVFCECTGKRTA